MNERFKVAPRITGIEIIKSRLNIKAKARQRSLAMSNQIVKAHRKIRLKSKINQPKPKIITKIIYVEAAVRGRGSKG